jgi:hypothetical protein
MQSTKSALFQCTTEAVTLRLRLHLVLFVMACAPLQCGHCNHRCLAAGSLAAAGQHLGARAASGGLGGLGSASQAAAGGPGAESAAAAARQQRRGAGGSILWHSGNMYGMQVGSWDSMPSFRLRSQSCELKLVAADLQAASLMHQLAMQQCWLQHLAQPATTRRQSIPARYLVLSVPSFAEHSHGNGGADLHSDSTEKPCCRDGRHHATLHCCPYSSADAACLYCGASEDVVDDAITTVCSIPSSKRPGPSASMCSSTHR